MQHCRLCRKGYYFRSHHCHSLSQALDDVGCVSVKCQCQQAAQLAAVDAVSTWQFQQAAAFQGCLMMPKEQHLDNTNDHGATDKLQSKQYKVKADSGATDDGLASQEVYQELAQVM